MCRFVAYLGKRVLLEDLLHRPDNALIGQTYKAQMMPLLNLGGFGFVAWDAQSTRASIPYEYRSTELPIFDRNLYAFSQKIAADCLVAHVRGVPYSPHEVITATNVHPFRLPRTRLAMAHNGALSDFPSIRRELASKIPDEFINGVQGTTDSEWLYVLVMAHLSEPSDPTLEDTANAVRISMQLIHAARQALSIRSASGSNLVLSNGDWLIATRLMFDYGWFREGPYLDETFPYTSLWYTSGVEYSCVDGAWQMQGGDIRSSFLLASEPLSVDTSGWVEAPEQSLLKVSRSDSKIHLQTQALDLDA